MSYFYKNHRMKHLTKNEAHIWSRFLDKYEYLYHNYVYDTLLPQNIDIPSGFDGKTKLLLIKLKARRIDVVMQDIKYIWIVEIRHGAQQTAMGQALLYKHLFADIYKPPKPIRLMILTDRLNPELSVTCNQAGIVYMVP